MLTACGGSSDNASNSQLSSTDIPSWTLNQFDDASIYKDRCALPRTGIDSFTEQNFPDQPGSSMHEKMWLRSWSNDTYLWYNEIDDNDPTPFSVNNYFEQLKTTQLTDSGSPKDNFHFTQPTEEYNNLAQNGVASSYGIHWAFKRLTAPRELIISYIDDNSPAQRAGLTRGLQLTMIDDIDFINSESNTDIDNINEALFPADRNQTHLFTFIDLNNNNLETGVSLTSENLTLSYVQNVKTITSNNHQIGYLRFNAYNSVAQSNLIAAIEQLSNANVSEIVVDLRYNGGGLLAMASQFAYMIAGQAQTNNSNFETSKFNDQHPTINPITGNRIESIPFYDKEINWNTNRLTNTTLPSVNLPRIFVLTTDATCSASEAFINGLKGINLEVIQIGATTCGKPYGFFPEDNCGTTYFTIQFQGVNDQGFGEYADGFTPTNNPQFAADIQGCVVEDDFTHQLGNENEALLAAAIHYVETNQCPVNQNISRISSKQPVNETGLAIKQPKTKLNSFFFENKIYQTVKSPEEN